MGGKSWLGNRSISWSTLTKLASAALPAVTCHTGAAPWYIWGHFYKCTQAGYSLNWKLFVWIGCGGAALLRERDILRITVNSLPLNGFAVGKSPLSSAALMERNILHYLIYIRSIKNAAAKGFYGAGMVFPYVLRRWNSYNVTEFLCSFRPEAFFSLHVLPCLLLYFFFLFKWHIMELPFFPSRDESYRLCYHNSMIQKCLWAIHGYFWVF